MATKPCAVCKYPVEIEETRMEVWEDRDKEPDGAMGVMAVCGSRRCQRLVKKALQKHGRERAR